MSTTLSFLYIYKMIKINILIEMAIVYLDAK